MDEKREKHHRTGGEERGEFVTTRFMVQDLKLFTLGQLKLMTRKDVVKSYDGDVNNNTHLNRAGDALKAAITHHPENN